MSMGGNKGWKRGGPRVRPRVSFEGAGRTRGSEAAKTDLNRILQPYRDTGQMPGDPAGNVFGDVSDFGSFRDHMEKVRRGKEIFAALDATDRAKFGNDPVAFFKFVGNPENREEVVRMRFGEQFAERWVRSELLKKRRADEKRLKEDAELHPPKAPEPPKEAPKAP